MDDISIKILDSLFDLCDGENFVILDAQDLTSRIPDCALAPDELVEIIETLDADELIDLRYADEEEFCVAMKTKGRALIKQIRDRLQKVVATAESASVSSPVEDEASPGQDAPAAEAPRARHMRERSSFEYEQRTRSSSESHARPDPEREEEADKPKASLEKRVMLYAAIGAAAATFLFNIIFLIIYLVMR